MSDTFEHMVNGLRSDIHPCCILWYVTGWRYLRRHHFPMSKRYLQAILRVEKVHGIEFEHIPCPLCLILGWTSPVNETPCVHLGVF